MATVTKTMATLVDNNQTAIVEVDYDDVALRLTALRVVNNTARDVLAMATKQANGRVYSTTFPANQTTFIPIPNTPPADRVGITIDAQGRIVGVEWSVRFAG